MFNYFTSMYIHFRITNEIQCIIDAFSNVSTLIIQTMHTQKSYFRSGNISIDLNKSKRFYFLRLTLIFVNISFVICLNSLMDFSLIRESQF